MTCMRDDEFQYRHTLVIPDVQMKLFSYSPTPMQINIAQMVDFIMKLMSSR